MPTPYIPTQAEQDAILPPSAPPAPPPDVAPQSGGGASGAPYVPTAAEQAAVLPPSFTPGGEPGASAVAGAARSLLGTDGGRLGCASTACRILSAAGIPFPMTPSAAGMEQQMGAHGFVRADPSEADVLFGRGTGPSGRHVMVHVGGGQTVEDPGGGRGNRVQYGRVPVNDPTLTGWKYAGGARLSAPAQGAAPGQFQGDDPLSGAGPAAGGAQAGPGGGPYIPNAAEASAALAVPSAAPPTSTLPLAAGTSAPAQGTAPAADPYQVANQAVHVFNAKAAAGTATDADKAALRAVIAQQMPLQQAQGPAKFNSPQNRAAYAAYKDMGLIGALPDFAGKAGPAPAPLNFAQTMLGLGPTHGTIYTSGKAILGGLGQLGKEVVRGTLGEAFSSQDDQSAGRKATDASADTVGGALFAAPVTQAVGPQSLLGHAAAAAGQGPQAFGKFAQGVPAGVGKETVQNPVGQLMNVVSLVGGGGMTLARGAEGMTAAAGKLGEAADAAQAAGDLPRAAGLRQAAQTAGNMGQDLKVASARYTLAASGGKAGDYAANTAANLARKYFPGSPGAAALTRAALGRSLGRAVSDAYPGFKVQRAQDQGRITPQAGDVNLGAGGPALLPATRGGTAPAASPLRAVLTGQTAPALSAPPSPPLTGRQTAPAPASMPPLRPASTSPAMQPPLTSPGLTTTPPGLTAPPAGKALHPTEAGANGEERAMDGTFAPLLPAPPQSPAGKDLHPTADGANGAGRHSDGTFAPVVPSASAPAPLPSQDARLVPGFPVSQLHLDPERFQYKIGTGQGGNSGSLTDARAFNPDFAGVVHAWRDPADGRAYVVNGHNRVGLAQRTGTPGVDVRFLDAATAGEARTKGALINIAEGQGTAIDAAKLFRDTGHTQEDIANLGVNLTGQKASQGLALAKLNPGLFSSVMKGEMPVERAAIIGGKLPDHGDQQTLLKQMGERSLTNGQLGEMADAIAQGPRHTSQTSSLFGADEVSASLAPERAEAADYINSQLAREGGAFGNASKNADRLARGNNVIDAAESARLATLSAQGREIFGQVKNAPGEVSDLLNAAAKRLARAKETGETRDAIKRDALGQYQGYVERFPRGGAGPAPSDPGPGGSLPARAGGGADGGRQAGAGGGGLFGGSAGLRPGRSVPEGTGERRPGSTEASGRETPSRPSVTPSPVLTPAGRQIALRGASGTVYVNPAAYNDLMGRLGASGASQGVTLKPPHVQQVQTALSAAVRAAGPGRPAYVAELNAVADHLSRAGRGKSGSPKSGVAVVKVEPGQTLSETKAVARHERTHAASYDYPLSQASRDALDKTLSRPSHPLSAAYGKAKAALTARGYAPAKTWEEIPAVLSAGPSQYSKMGLNDDEAQELGVEYGNALADEHGPDAVRAVFSHGASAARQVARQVPAGTAPAPASGHALTPAAPGDVAPGDQAPDESKFRDVTRFIGRPRFLTLEEVADVRKAGLLSSPKQVVKAVAGHVAALASDDLARLPASLTDLIVAAATGRDRTVGGLRVRDMAQAAKIGATAGVKLGAGVMRHGAHGLAARGVTNPLLPANHPEFHTGMGLLDAYVNGVFRMHESAYAGLKVFALHRALLELAHLGALNSVRRGLVPKAQQEALRQHLYSQPSPTMLAAAIGAAEEATLTNGSAFSEMYQGMWEKAPPVGKLVMSQVVPFPKIESNVAGRSLEMATGAAYGPLRFALQAMKQRGFSGDQQRRFSLTFGRGLVGLGLIALGAAIGAKKLAGVSGQPSDEKHHRPGTVEAGGRIYPTNTVAPLSNLVQLGIDAAAAREGSGEDGEGVTAHAGDALANLLMEQPYLKANPGDLTEMLTGGGGAKRQLGQQMGSFVPAVLADVAAQRDPYKRVQKEPLDFVKARIPGRRETLPVLKDLLGNPVPEAPGRLFNPFGGTPAGAADSPALRELREVRDEAQGRRQTGDLRPADAARRDLTRGLLDRAAHGRDIRPDVKAALQGRQLNLPEARLLLRDARLSPLQQRMEGLPLDDALDVYRLGRPDEQAAWRPVLAHKLMSAARSRSLTPAQVQRAREAGLGPRR